MTAASNSEARKRLADPTPHTDPTAADVRAAQAEVRQWCREEDEHGDRCAKRAEFLLWGKLFPPAALGPRCYDHAVERTHWGMPSRPDQWAVLDLRNLYRADRLATDAAAPEGWECGDPYSGIGCPVPGCTHDPKGWPEDATMRPAAPVAVEGVETVETLAEVLAELGVCPFREDVNDASMCVCGLPALNHDEIAASIVLRDFPAIARIVQARAGEGALRERIEALADDCQHSRHVREEDPTITRRDGENVDVEAVLRAALDPEATT